MRLLQRLFLAIAFCFTALCVHAQGTLTPQDAFEAGIEMAEAKKHREAIAFFLIANQAQPDSVGVLWNLGISSAEIGEHREALKYWQAFRKQRPQEWRGLAKLVQTYQALGDIAARDRERAALIEQYKNAPPQSDLGRTEMFCREQMVIAGRKVLGFEYFAPQGERRVFYAFIVVSEADGNQEDFRLSLGSYDATTQIAWEMGSLPRDKRIYHLDKYQGQNHWTYGLYEEPQSYEAVRTQVVEVLSGRAQVLSSTTRKP